MNTKPGPSGPPYHPLSLPHRSLSLPLGRPPFLIPALPLRNSSSPKCLRPNFSPPHSCQISSSSHSLSSCQWQHHMVPPPTHQHSSLVIFPENLPVVKSCGLFRCLCPSLLLPRPHRGPSPQLGPCPVHLRGYHCSSRLLPTPPSPGPLGNWTSPSSPLPSESN